MSSNFGRIVTLGIASMTLSACVNVGGINVGGIKANTDIKANTSVDVKAKLGDKLVTPTSEPTPALSASPTCVEFFGVDGSSQGTSCDDKPFAPSPTPRPSLAPSQAPTPGWDISQFESSVSNGVSPIRSKTYPAGTAVPCVIPPLQGAALYAFEVYPGDLTKPHIGGGASVYNKEGTNTDLGTLPTYLSAGTYTYRAIALFPSASGNDRIEGPWVVFHLTASTQDSAWDFEKFQPPAGIQIVGSSVEFDFPQMASAETYYVEVRNSEETLVFWKHLQKDAHSVKWDGAPAGDYSWRVTATDKDGQGTLSPFSRFRVVANATAGNN